jgi:hypothetical protein
MLAELLYAAEWNDSHGKTTLFELGLIVSALALLGCLPVALARPD